VSVEDADLLAAHYWSVDFSGRKPYARGHVPGSQGKKACLHRAITGAAGEAQVDHINGGGLDNRRLNLRPASRSQNQVNRRAQRRRSPHIPPGMELPKGVLYTPDRKTKPFRTIVARKFVGRFATAAEAARAYDARARELWGE
jgi:hypothetical protein